jgi:hypothetical protein
MSGHEVVFVDLGLHVENVAVKSPRVEAQVEYLHATVGLRKQQSSSRHTMKESNSREGPRGLVQVCHPMRLVGKELTRERLVDDCVHPGDGARDAHSEL